MSDILLTDMMIQGISPDGAAWLTENIAFESWQGTAETGIAVDRRFSLAIIGGAIQDGLEVIDSDGQPIIGVQDAADAAAVEDEDEEEEEPTPADAPSFAIRYLVHQVDSQDADGGDDEGDDEEAFAFFEDDLDVYTVYTRIGQHGSASPEYLEECREATPEEYADLHEELTRIYAEPEVGWANRGATLHVLNGTGTPLPWCMG